MSDLTQVWTEVQARLPSGWTIDSLRCASSGLGPHQRSEDWIAVAVTADGQERRYQAIDPEQALRGLAESF